MNRFFEYLGLSLLIHFSAQAAVWEQPLTDVQKYRLASGEVIFLEPEAGYLVAAAIEINAPAEFIWKAMLDHESLPTYLKDVRSNRLLERGETWKVLEQRLKVHPLLPQFEYVFREEYGLDHLLKFKRQSGGIREMMGWWKLIPVDDGESTILMYSVFMDVGWYVPESWMRNGIEKRVPRLLTIFREEVCRRLKNQESSGGFE